MCGITGYFDPSGTYVNSSNKIASHMSSAIRHRGPDNCDVWFNNDRRLVLAHQRLSIIDLSTEGNQPMHSSSGRYVIIFNGEIYNHRELKKLFPNKVWRGTSDTEVLLEAIERWGIISTLKRCNGMFAIVLWDRKLKRLTLARDRLGEKPLYYGWNSNVLLFTSELKALKFHPAFESEIDLDSIGLYFQFGYIPASSSIYKKIKKVSSGSVVQFNLYASDYQCADSTKYWSLKSSVTHHADHKSSFTNKNPTDELEKILINAIKEESIADVQLGSFLSGGVDSSLISALLQREIDSNLQTFSIGFEEEKYNESQYAQVIANHLGTDHNELILKPDDLKNVIPKLPTLFDEPFGDPSAVPMLLVSEFAKSSLTVCLSGDGGDELFGGYPRYHRTAYIWSRIEQMPKNLRNAMNILMQPLIKISYDRDIFLKLQRLGSYLECNSLIDCYKLQSQTNFKDLKKLLNTDLNILNHDIPECVTGYEAMMYLDAVTYLPDDILVKVDRAAMSVSLETRAPFLNHQVVEFAFNLPQKYKINGQAGKIILKDLLSRYIPSELFERPKMGFGIPIDDWLRKDLREWTEDNLNNSHLESMGFFNTKLIRKRLDQHIKGKRDWHYFLWHVLMFIEWYRSADI